jgi:hypothetical protein
MDATIRARELAKIKKNDKPFMTGIRITFEGETQSFDAYKIPLKYLIYNKYNGRIGSLVKSYEKQNRPLNAERLEDAKKIEEFLWASNKPSNEATERSLVKEGQKQYGIVTYNGVIIDGNRRAYLLNKIYRERENWEEHDVDHCMYFTAVILNAGASPKEVSKLETVYQMGEDAKLDYNAIEKYLKCKDLNEKFGFTPNDIAEMMGEKKSRIEEWLQIMKLMDGYLSYLEYDGIYTRLDNREGQFVDFNRYLNRWIEGNKNADWAPTEADIADLKAVCFDYIRAEYEGKEFRNIAFSGKNGSIFAKEAVWGDFLDRHTKKIENIKEKSVEQWIDENPPHAELYKVLEARDKDWQGKAAKNLKENLRRATSRVDAINESDKPQILLGKAFDFLKAINTDVDSFYETTNEDILKRIQKLTFDYLKKIRNNHNA